MIQLSVRIKKRLKLYASTFFYQAKILASLRPTLGDPKKY